MNKLIALLIFSAAAFAQNTTTVTASLIHGGGITLLAKGSLCFTPVDDSGNPQPYRSGAGGQGTVDEKCAAVTNGAIGSWSVDNPDFTSPLHLKYTIRVLDANGREIRRDTAVDMSGNGGTWSYDSFTPSAGTVLGNFSCPTGYVVTGITSSGQLICSVGGSGSGISSLNGLSGASQTFANDTNVTITSTGTTHALGWAGTLASSRMPATTVNAVTNDTNITGSISSQNLTLGFTGTLAKARQNAQTVYLDAASQTFVNGITAPSFSGALTGNASTASALAGTPSTCGAGNYARGILADGSATGCTVAGGGGTVTTFSAGNLSPLFTANVTNPTTTPALAFTLSNAAAHSFFGNNTGSTGAPAFAQPAFSDLSGSVAASQMPALTGDVTSSAGTVATVLPNIVSASTQTKITYNAKGQVTAGAQAQFSDIGGSVAAGQMPALTGDVTSSAGSTATTLASVVTAGSCGDATHSCGLTYDAKGRITAATNNSITGTGSGFTAPTSWSAVSGNFASNTPSGNVGFQALVTASQCAASGTCSFDSENFTVTPVSGSDMKARSFTVNATGATDAGGGRTWSYEYDNLFSHITGGHMTHLLAHVERLYDDTDAGTTTDLASTLYVTHAQNGAGANGAFGNVEAGHFEITSWNGSGSATNAFATVNAAITPTATGGFTTPLNTAYMAGDPTATAFGTCRVAFAVGTPSCTGAVGLYIPTSGTYLHPIVTGSGVNYFASGLVMGAVDSFTSVLSSTLLETICNGTDCMHGAYNGNGTFEWGLKDSSANYGVRRSGAGTFPISIIRTTGQLELGELSTWGTASALAFIEGTAPTNVSGVATLYPDSTSHMWSAAMNGASGVQTITAGMPSPISSTGNTATVSNGTPLCPASAGACNIAGFYRVTAYVDSTVTCGTPGSASIGVNVTYTDDAGTKTAQTIPLSVNGGTTLASTMALGNTTNSAYGSATFWSTGASAIGYGMPYVACTSGTGTFGKRIVVQRLF